MWPFSRSEKTEEPKPGRKLKFAPAPNAILRPLKNPFYDTVRAEAGVPDSLVMFQEKVGVGVGYEQTNMICGGDLPVPYEFDLYRFRAEFSPESLPRDCMTLRFHSMFEWRFAGTPWLAVPFSFVPCHVFTKDEDMKFFASAIIGDGELMDLHLSRWAEAKEKELTDIPDIDKKELCRGEGGRSIAVNGEPVRIRSRERFEVRIVICKEDWQARGLSLEKPVDVRVYMEGVVYKPL